MQNEPQSATTLELETVPQKPAQLPAPASAVATVPIAGAKPAALAVQSGTGIVLSNTEEMMRFAKIAVESGLAPRSLDTPQKVFVALQMGAELGLAPMASLQNIAVIQNRPSLWGDAVPGICQATGQMEDYKDEKIGVEGQDTYGVRCTVKRAGRSSPIIREFTVGMAKKAGLWQKAGPWSQMPERMLLMRARTFAMRDAFPDTMRGLVTQDEAQDAPPRNVTHSLDAIDSPAAK